MPRAPFPLQALLIAIAPLLPGLDWTALGRSCSLSPARPRCWRSRPALLRDVVPLGREDARFATAALLALGLLVHGTRHFASWSAHNLYHGYVGLAVYHNPTLILLKPLAVQLW